VKRIFLPFNDGSTGGDRSGAAEAGKSGIVAAAASAAAFVRNSRRLFIIDFTTNNLRIKCNLFRGGYAEVNAEDTR
jgi:hypothetical protein